MTKTCLWAAVIALSGTVVARADTFYTAELLPVSEGGTVTGTLDLQINRVHEAPPFEDGGYVYFTLSLAGLRPAIDYRLHVGEQEIDGGRLSGGGFAGDYFLNEPEGDEVSADGLTATQEGTWAGIIRLGLDEATSKGISYIYPEAGWVVQVEDIGFISTPPQGIEGLGVVATGTLVLVEDGGVPIPEPASAVLLLGVAGAGLTMRRRTC